MSFLRPESLAVLRRWREVAGAALVVLAGCWTFTLGGWFFQGIGVLVAMAGLAGAVIALRRLRFARAVGQPGIVEVDEAQVRYFGPTGGGFAAIPDLVEVELLADMSGQLWWRLSEAGGNVLAVPVAAEGADQLFDVFSNLPGLTTARLLGALDGEVRGTVTVWRAGARRALT